ncbi:MAG: dihydropteroate synthase [Eubacteriaceae bacterium]|nr:dihydropteroate synthase [Eubacteriaceae bacterium]
MVIGKRDFDLDNKCYVMGILNTTPDSFYDNGRYKTFDAALKHAQAMVDAGADIIDVGGESTKPGYTMVSEQEEIDNVASVIEACSKRFDLPVSIDTYKSKVASEAISAGAVMVNDIWGLKHDGSMAGLIASKGVACCLMHNRHGMGYNSFMQDLLDDLGQSLALAESAGIPKDKIMLDPGVGFAKTYNMNLEAINKISQIRALGYPVLLGASRKSTLGKVLDLPVGELLEGSLAAAVMGVARGASVLRVHDVKETKRAITIAHSIICERMPEVL